MVDPYRTPPKLKKKFRIEVYVPGWKQPTIVICDKYEALLDGIAYGRLRCQSYDHAGKERTSHMFRNWDHCSITEIEVLKEE